MIPVTKTFFPPIHELNAQIQRIYDNGWLTNRGELVLELEAKISHFLNTSRLLITNNGTIPLQLALKTLGDGGEIITTPFSYVATTSSIVWEGFTPVFVDIEPTHLTIDVTKIEAAITPKTKAILATHVFGNPCDVDQIAAIATKHNLKVIYDGAHAFGVKYKGKSLFEYGDISTCSFHATKLFHTGEGGAVFTQDESVYHKLFYSHNFGHKGPLAFHGLGINGKISELQAAMGLAVLPYVNDIIADRKKTINAYRKNINNPNIKFIEIRQGTEWNYSYFPILFSSEKQLLTKLEELSKHDIFPRRYFYPSLNTLPYLSPVSMPVSESVSSRIICLPLYHQIEQNILQTIVDILNA